MTEYCYLNVQLKLKEDIGEILPTYLLGAIENNLRQIFGEIGGCTTIELHNFEEKNFILKVPSKDTKKLRVALTLLSTFQGIASYFKVISVSNTSIQVLT